MKGIFRRKGQPRTYRQLCKSDLKAFTVSVRETDLALWAEKDLTMEATDLVLKYRHQIEEYISLDPVFATTLIPHPVSPDAPLIVKSMAESAACVGVGPMAAVAGAIAEFVGKDLLIYSQEVIIENGGDNFLHSTKLRRVGIYAGNSPFSFRIALEIEPQDMPVGVCTSSGTVGHSLSFGKVDAAVVISPSATFADAAATAIANLIQTPEDIPRGIEFARHFEQIRGVLLIIGEKMGAWGKLKLISLE